MGISACSLTGFLGSSELNDRFWASLAEAIGVYHERQPVRVELLSLFTGTSSEQDDTVNDLIESLLPPGIPVLRRRYSRNVREFAQEFLRCEWYVCTKYHAALAAYLAGSNFAVVTYNRKVSDLADEIAMPAARRVAADGVQPVSAWLDLFQSLGSFDVAPQLLDRRRAAARARQAVCGSLESIGMHVSSRHHEAAV
jgi:polysaccharide pyruvyl transferase WcaK-like protein